MAETPLMYAAATSTAPEVVVKPLTQGDVRAAVVKAFPDAPVMVLIASCESHFRQFNADGSVLKGVVNPGDKGVFQINAHYHETASESMGLDIYTLSGNLKYARYLYETSGTSPWNASKPMWSKGECK